MRLRALVESALTLLCWECRGPGILQDKWGGGTRVPRGRSDLSTLSVAFEQKAWMKRPLPERISAASSSGPRCVASLLLTPQWLPSTLRLSLLVSLVALGPPRSSELQGHEVMMVGGTGPGWRRPLRGLKEGGHRGLEALSSQCLLGLGDAPPGGALGVRPHSATRGGTSVTSGVPAGAGGMSIWVMAGDGGMSKLRLGGYWTEDHGEGVQQGARLGAPSPSPGPRYKAAVGVGRGVIHSFILQTHLGLQLCVQPHTGDLDSKPVETLAQVPVDRAGEHRDSREKWGGPRTPTCPAPLPLPALSASASHPITNPVQAHTCLLADPPGCYAGSNAEASSQGLLCPRSLPGRPLEVTPRKTPQPFAPGPDPCPLVPTRRLEAVVPVGRVHAGLRGRPADADAHLPARTGH